MDSSSSDSGDEEFFSLLPNVVIPELLVKKSKNENYVEQTVPLYTEKQFIEHFRVSREIVSRLEVEFEASKYYPKTDAGYLLITREECILAFLWFASNETTTFRDVADRFDLSVSTLHGIVENVAMFLSDMSNSVIDWPSADECKVIADEFAEMGFPNAIGCIDGTHIRIDAPSDDSESYLNRKKYHSIQLQQAEVEGQEQHRRFRIENGDSPGEKDEMFGSPSTPVLENPEYQTRWYFKFFLGRLHQNYVGLDNDKSPFFLSIVLNEDKSTCVPICRAILFKKTGAQKISLPMSQNKVLTVKQIMSNFPNMDKIEKGPKEIFSPDIQKDLLLLEEQEGSVNFKFGVIYMKQGQTSDDDILSNENGSHRFEEFLSLLGDKIKLRGWDKYRGGLDIKGDMTGQFSVYTRYEGHEIMFHVSTLLPYSRDNRQQVERKRHIGNDIVNIVFVDARDDPEGAHSQFNPTYIKSQFTHVFAVVTIDNDDQYRLSVFSDEAVPLFGPGLPCPPVFTDPYLFRQFLLVKLINGEKATFETPTFSRKRQRTLDMLIRDLYSEHMIDSRMEMEGREQNYFPGKPDVHFSLAETLATALDNSKWRQTTVVVQSII